ncbi:hypothetical protein RS130_18030 [Paraglaciecola aquimarina]|uniref:Outer membrane protein beta-barrel domain-containing protein n=1 Tax=Paraglaciecola aquimarina TaxID=1235557 RepID=A0ABU3SZX1_9ALTE|nr:hypothetical protein [Paraglaciecola aquimarina]MDU0355538.1 hypothetical protein [Paraglaciecola aquimarina]
MSTYKIRSKSVIAASCLAICCSFTAAAEDSNSAGVGLSVKVGTLGPGLELDYRVNDYFNFRLQGNSFSYDDDFEEDGIDYNGELDLSNYGILLDVRPFGGTFRFTGGAYSNSNELRGSATSDGSEIFEIGDQEYRGSSGDKPLALEASVALGSGTAGYFGLGWGNSDPTGWMFSFELGVLFSGTPEVELNYSGTAERVGDPNSSFDVTGDSAEAQLFRAEINKEKANLEEDISDFEYYPVIALGIGYRF